VPTPTAAAPANDQIRNRLKAVRAQIDEVRDQRATLIKDRDDAKEAFATANINISEPGAHDTPEFKAAEEAVRSLGEADDKLADFQATERGLLGMLGETSPPDPSGNGPSPNGHNALKAWDGHRLLAGDASAYKDAADRGTFTSSAQFGSVVLGEVAGREQFQEFLSAVDSTNKLGATTADRRGFVQPLLKPLTLLDIIPVGTTDSSSVEYVQVQAVPTGAVETAELAAKPELGLTTVDATAPVRTIAGYVKLGRQALDDISGLASLINTLLPYEVRRRIEAQILNGDGVGQNLKGILQTSGIGAPAVVAGDNPADAILRAITVIVLSDGDPNFVALNPLTWQALMLMRENTGGAGTGGYLFGSPGMVMAPTIWGLATTANRTVPQTTPLVGDANGATLLVREGVNIKVSDADQDDFTRNRVTVLAEARVALPVWRPASFAKANT
jgi:HK97 family phage major capsid protein